MQIGSISDLSQSYSMQTRNSKLKTEIQRLTQELGSGQVADVRTSLNGSMAYVNDLERSLERNQSYAKVAVEVQQFAGNMQIALEHVGTVGTALSDTLLTSMTAVSGTMPDLVAGEARGGLDSMIAALNTSVGGRSLFGGTATDRPPLVQADALMSALSGAVAGAGSVDDIIAAAEAWFDDPAGFAAVAYQGSNTSLAAVAISDFEKAQFDVRADDPALRDMLRTVALVAIADDPALGLSGAERKDLYQKSTAPILGAQASVIDLQARTGIAERLVETVSARNSAEHSALELARNSLMAADPYQAATELEAVQFQLQSIYAITSRMSQLSLVNFL
nr:flagellin [uncultured Sulfitobacter sp.]